MINWKQKSPMDMANRIVACDILRSIGPEKIAMIKDDVLKNSFLLPCVDDKDKEYFEIDWKFVIFEMTDYQMGKLMENFQPKEKEKEEPKKVLLYDGKGSQIK